MSSCWTSVATGLLADPFAAPDDFLLPPPPAITAIKMMTTSKPPPPIIICFLVNGSWPARRTACAGRVGGTASERLGAPSLIAPDAAPLIGARAGPDTPVGPEPAPVGPEPGPGETIGAEPTSTNCDSATGGADCSAAPRA